MAGLLGMMAAGAAKGYSGGRGNELAQEKEFNLKSAFLDAQMDKELRLKEAGYEMEDKRNEADRERKQSYGADVVGEDGAARSATPQDIAQRAMKDGDYDTAAKISAMSPKAQKIEIEQLAYDAANGDEKAQKTLDKLLNFEKQKAAAGRAPREPKAPTATEISKQDFISAYGDNPEYVKNGKLTAKGYDKFNKIDDNKNQVEITEEPLLDAMDNPVLDEQGNPKMTRKRKYKEDMPVNTDKPVNKVGKWVPGKGLVYD